MFGMPARAFGDLLFTTSFLQSAQTRFWTTCDVFFFLEIPLPAVGSGTSQLYGVHGYPMLVQPARL